MSAPIRQPLRAPALLSAQSIVVAEQRPSGAWADAYFAWVRRSFLSLVWASQVDEQVTLRLLGLPAITLRRTEVSIEKTVFVIEGGLFAKRGGTFTFACEDDVLHTVLEGFETPLPRALYSATHGRLHEWVMRAFLRSVRSRSLARAE